MRGFNAVRHKCLPEQTKAFWTELLQTGKLSMFIIDFEAAIACVRSEHVRTR